MAQKSGFFDTTLDDPREYPAREFAEYFSLFIGSGIFGGGTTLKVEPGGGHAVSINIGYAWINGYMYSVFGEPIILNLQESDGANRIDRIVLRLDTSIRKRCITVEVKQGDSATVPPALDRTGDIYELSLARVFVQNGKTIIDGSQITDERLDNEVCGIVTGVIEQADTTAIFNQFQTWYTTRTDQYQQEWDDWLSSAAALFGAEWETWFNSIKHQWQDWFDSVSKDAPVVSVNGKAGVVVLNAADVGAADKSVIDNATSNATGDTLVKRDANSQFKVGAPTEPDHMARMQDLPTVPAFATQAQAEAGADNTTIMTPQRTNQAIQALVPQPDVIWRINTSNNLPEWSNDNGGSWNPVSANGILIASDNYKEGDPTERMLSLSGVGNQSLVYKFIPKFTGEIRIKADVKRIQGSYGVEFSVIAPARKNSPMYISSVGLLENFIYTVPVGSVVNVNILNTSSYSITRLGTTANNTNVYVSMTGTIYVFENVPVYLTTHSQENGSGAIKNIEICYDVIYK